MKSKCEGKAIYKSDVEFLDARTHNQRLMNQKDNILDIIPLAKSPLKNTKSMRSTSCLNSDIMVLDAVHFLISKIHLFLGCMSNNS